ncbi:MAG: hypothetical protein JWL86_4565 [Rhizobium sp.]|nr:hypothetical protein [Rhizobium sp.]
MALQHPVTPVGRYFVVKGGLWRLANRDLAEGEKSALVSELMRGRRAVKTAKQQVDVEAEAAAHRDVDAAEHALGDRGPVWRTNSDLDLNRHLVKYTPYAWAGNARRIDGACRTV